MTRSQGDEGSRAASSPRRRERTSANVSLLSEALCAVRRTLSSSKAGMCLLMAASSFSNSSMGSAFWESQKIQVDGIAVCSEYWVARTVFPCPAWASISSIR